MQSTHIFTDYVSPPVQQIFALQWNSFVEKIEISRKELQRQFEETFQTQLDPNFKVTSFLSKEKQEKELNLIKECYAVILRPISDEQDIRLLLDSINMLSQSSPYPKIKKNARKFSDLAFTIAKDFRDFTSDRKNISKSLIHISRHYLGRIQESHEVREYVKTHGHENKAIDVVRNYPFHLEQIVSQRNISFTILKNYCNDKAINTALDNFETFLLREIDAVGQVEHHTAHDYYQRQVRYLQQKITALTFLQFLNDIRNNDTQELTLVESIKFLIIEDFFYEMTFKEKVFFFYRILVDANRNTEEKVAITECLERTAWLRSAYNYAYFDTEKLIKEIKSLLPTNINEINDIAQKYIEQLRERYKNEITFKKCLADQWIDEFEIKLEDFRAQFLKIEAFLQKNKNIENKMESIEKLVMGVFNHIATPIPVDIDCVGSHEIPSTPKTIHCTEKPLLDDKRDDTSRLSNKMNNRDDAPPKQTSVEVKGKIQQPKSFKENHPHMVSIGKGFGIAALALGIFAASAVIVYFTGGVGALFLTAIYAAAIKTLGIGGAAALVFGTPPTVGVTAQVIADNTRSGADLIEIKSENSNVNSKRQLEPAQLKNPMEQSTSSPNVTRKVTNTNQITNTNPIINYSPTLFSPAPQTPMQAQVGNSPQPQTPHRQAAQAP